jgi:urease accessory protein UreH
LYRYSEIGVLEVSRSGGKSAATRLFHRYPLRLLVPKKVTAPGADAVWCYSVSFGGGLVAGDKSGMSVSVVGLYKLNPDVTHSLKAPGLNT